MTTTKRRNPGRDYREFLRALRRGGWSVDQITGDAPQPPELVSLLTGEVGLARAEKWLIKALDAGDLKDPPSCPIQLTDPEPTPEQVEAAYDRACPCLPEIEAATARRLPPYDEHVEQQAREQPCGTCGEPLGEHGPDDLGPEGECQMEDDAPPTSSGLGSSGPLPGKPAANHKTKPPRDVQTRINALVWRYGANVAGRAEGPALLTEARLAATDLTPAALERATRYVAEKTYEIGPLVWRPMVTEPFEGGTAVQVEVWRTKCGRYKIARVLGADPRFVAVARIGKPAARERVIGNDLRNLEAALAAVDAYHSRLLGEPATGNGRIMVDEAVRNGTHKIPRPTSIESSTLYNDLTEGDVPAVQTITRDGRTTMKITEAKARELLVACGWPTASPDSDKFDLKRLNTRLNDAAKMGGVPHAPEDAGLKQVYDDVLAALEAGTEITVGAGKKAPAGRPAAGGKAKAARTSPRAAGERDAYGSRVGSQAAAINAALGKTALTPAELAEKTKLPAARINGHLRWLLERKHVVAKDGSYAVKA